MSDQQEPKFGNNSSGLFKAITPVLEKFDPHLIAAIAMRKPDAVVARLKEVKKIKDMKDANQKECNQT